MPRKIAKLAHDHVCVNDKPMSGSSNWQKHPPSPLTMLPTELLISIFSYLSPLDLLNIQKLNIERLTEISLTSTCADFSGCNAVQNEELLSFFTRDRAVRIQEINFNDVFFVQNSILEKCIKRCKHLKKLYVYECGLSYSNILCILSQCKELEELYWSFRNDKALVLKQFIDETIYPKLRKLYLSHTDEYGILDRVHDKLAVLLNRCTNKVEVCVNFSPYFTTTLPPSMGKRIYVGNKDYLPISTLQNVGRDQPLEKLGNEDNVQFKITAKLLYGYQINKTLPELFTFHSSFLQLITEEDQLNAMPLLPKNSVDSLVLIMTEAKLRLENHVEKLKRVTGEKLKHLTVHKTKTDSERKMAIWETIPQWDFLTEIVSACVNIQVLNLSELHFPDSLPFASFYCLKDLKVLNLSGCSLRSPITFNAVVFQEGNFENLISHCKNVEVFSLYGCKHCQHGPTDEELMPIAKWPKLTLLLISGIVTLRRCHFLPRIVESCPRLACLDFHKIGDPSVCHYIPSVISVLRKSKQLKFLRLQQEGFQPDNSLFWKSVALCQSLQGLCLSSKVKTPLPNKYVTDSIAELPFFHLFHLNIPRLCYNLSSQIKSILIKNGVKCMSICTENACLGLRGRICCNLPHFPW